MTAELLDGKKCALEVLDRLRAEVDSLPRKPHLAVVRVGNDPGSAVYVKAKRKNAAKIGFESTELHLAETIEELNLAREIQRLNENPVVDGILVQLPLPKHINSDKILEIMAPEKDVDGFHPQSLGRLVMGAKGFEPCTPKGIIHLLKSNQVAIAGKDAVVIGRSIIVGKPISMLLLREHATVTICHSHTHDLPAKVRSADILIAAIGRAEMIRGEWLKPGVVVVDVGINRQADGRLVGDCHFESCANVASKITPVPGGVGPMTIAMLMQNTFIACQQRLFQD